MPPMEPQPTDEAAKGGEEQPSAEGADVEMKAEGAEASEEQKQA